MATALQSCTTTQTTAPDYYKTYLCTLATQGIKAMKCADYIGAQPLQTKAFRQACANYGDWRPELNKAEKYFGCAAKQDVTGAASGYLGQMGEGALAAANPYLTSLKCCSPAKLAQSYMDPYIQCVVKSMSDIAQRNIQQNLSPLATSAAVGSGQFGSQRGAQVLGQMQANAMQDLNAEISKTLSTGYCQALRAAGLRQSLENEMARTAGCAAYKTGLNAIEGARTAACAAYKEGALQSEAGRGLLDASQREAAQNIACVNLLATMGEQCRALKQNKELFPLEKLTALSNLLQGAQIPMGTTKTSTGSGLQNFGALAGTGIEMLCKLGLWDTVKKEGGDFIKKLFGLAEGGAVGGLPPGYGCSSTRYRGALPKE